LFRETGLKSQGGDSAQDAESDQEDEPICGANGLAVMAILLIDDLS